MVGFSERSGRPVCAKQGDSLQRIHIPVLLAEAISALAVRPSGIYIDATVGQGGHAIGILEHSAPDGRLLAIDIDPQAVAFASERLRPYGARATVVQGNFAVLSDIAAAQGFSAVDGVLFDLGLCSQQIGTAGRGFSFQRDEPLDMRYSQEGPTAADLVNSLPEQELAGLLFRFGEERAARAIARAIVAQRPVLTTGQLARLVEGVLGRGGRIHPATRTFLALRIAVNRELETLAQALPQAATLLKPGGRLVVISFHGLEDRLVKRFLQRESKDCLCPPRMPVCACGHKAILKVITPKPVLPSAQEVATNPRARSARLRAAERLPQS